ncbi:MAG TPA: hypothetical protein VM733_09855 [Thermoanaerobaculia bacterium]|nr:hypothetical protein [Thermoanaerobaculia bacterium]
MTDYKKPPGHDCPPQPPDDPADQPKPPGGECQDPPDTEPPKLEDPEKCHPDPCCNCQPGPGSDPNCLEKLIAKQTNEIAAADKAKTFKADLEALHAKAKAASQEYTRDKYDKLVKQWVEEDRDIAELVRKLVCAVPCWRCIIECYVCTLLYDIRDAELRLYGNGKWCSEVHDVQDLLYWYGRDRAVKERAFNRIKNVLAAWEKPAQTIGKILTDNAKLIVDSGKLLGSEASKVVYDVFLRLIPLHLAIAPPQGSAWTTKIAKEYTKFCDCDTGKPDDCCGPDVGELSLRQRLIGPQPYLIDPNDYFKVICCLVDKRYGPAKDRLSKADAAVVATENEMKRLAGLIENGLKNFDANARTAIPAVVDCCDFEKDPDEPPPQPPPPSYRKY